MLLIVLLFYSLLSLGIYRIELTHLYRPIKNWLVYTFTCLRMRLASHSILLIFRRSYDLRWYSLWIKILNLKKAVLIIRQLVLIRISHILQVPFIGQMIVNSKLTALTPRNFSLLSLRLG